MTDLKIVENGWYQAECGAVFGPMKWALGPCHFEANGHAFDDIGHHFRGSMFGAEKIYRLIRRVNPPTDWVEPVVAENATTQDCPITRRDLFAAAALAGYSGFSEDFDVERIVEVADEVIAELDKEGEK